MPPPTMNMAAVPTTDSVFISQGASHSRPCPSFCSAALSRSVSASPASSIFTIPATRPYTPTVTARAMVDSTSTWVVKVAAATVPRVMATISAERMKSVRTAPLILSFSKATRSTLGSLSACSVSACRSLSSCRKRCASFSKPSYQRKAPPSISSGVINQGMKALISRAPGTRITLLRSDPLATAQTTGSSRSARTPVTCWAFSARSSPSTPAVFFAATLLIRDTSSSRVAISSSRASRLEAKGDTSSYRDTLHYCRRQGVQPIIDQNALRPRSGGAVMVPTGLQHAPQHAVLLHQLMQQGHADVAHHQDKQGPGDQRMDAAQGRHPFDVGGPTGHQLLAERGPAVAIANHDHQPGDRQQHHAQVKQPVAGLDQQSGRRILLGS